MATFCHSSLLSQGGECKGKGVLLKVFDHFSKLSLISLQNLVAWSYFYLLFFRETLRIFWGGVRDTPDQTIFVWKLFPSNYVYNFFAARKKKSKKERKQESKKMMYLTKTNLRVSEEKIWGSIFTEREKQKSVGEGNSKHCQNTFQPSCNCLIQQSRVAFTSAQQ